MSSQYVAMSATVAAAMEAHMQTNALAGFRQVQILGFGGKAKLSVNIGFLFDMSATLGATMLTALKTSIQAGGLGIRLSVTH